MEESAKEYFDMYMEEYKQSGTIDGKKMSSKLEARKAAMSKALKMQEHEKKEGPAGELKEERMEKETK